VLLAVAVRERRKLESHEARRGLRDVHGIHVGREHVTEGGWVGPQFQVRPPENEHTCTELELCRFWNKRPVSAGDGAASAGNVGRD
jgi:hypothetical protein